MNDLDLDSQLEGRLRHTFETVAAATPIDDTPWSRVRREAEGRPSPARWLVAAAAALLLVVGAVGVWWVATRPSSAPVADEPQPRVPLTTAPPPIDPPAPVAPEGEEYPIERISLPGGLDARALGQLQMVDASSFRFWSTSDATLFAFRSVGLQSDTVMEWLCDGQLNSDGGTSMGCGSALELSVRQNWGSSWEQPDGQPGHGIWQWSNVPADTDFVQYRVGDLVMWQRPVDGMASFPAASESNRGVVAIAYRADGAVLARVDEVTANAESLRANELFPELGDGSALDDERQQEAADGVTREFAACLRSMEVPVIGPAGDTPMAHPVAGQDMEPAWQACLVTTQEWLDDFVAEHS